MSYDAIAVARYCIIYINDNGGTISNLKLQKVLYFIQGFFFAVKNEECFKDEMIAWDFGPVIPEVYREFKYFGSNSIPTSATTGQYPYIKYTEYDANENAISESDKELIEMIVDSLKNISLSGLTDIIRCQEPWKNAYKEKETDSIIKKADIKKYFFEEYTQ